MDNNKKKVEEVKKMEESYNQAMEKSRELDKEKTDRETEKARALIEYLNSMIEKGEVDKQDYLSELDKAIKQTDNQIARTILREAKLNSERLFHTDLKTPKIKSGAKEDEKNKPEESSTNEKDKRGDLKTAIQIAMERKQGGVNSAAQEKQKKQKEVKTDNTVRKPEDLAGIPDDVLGVPPETAEEKTEEQEKQEWFKEVNPDVLTEESKEKLESLAQNVANAEIALKKAEKKQGKYEKIKRDLGAFIAKKSKIDKKDINANIDLEVQDAKIKLDEAKKKFNDLARRYAVENYADLAGSNKEEAKEKAIKIMLDSQEMLYDKRIGVIDKDRPAIVRGFKKTLDWYKKLPFEAHLAVMAGVIGVSALGSVPAMFTGGLFAAERIFTGFGAAATASSAAEWSFSRKRKKEGLTFAEQLQKGKEKLEQESKNTNLGELLLSDDFFNKYNDDLDSKIQSVIKRETRDNNKKMAYSAIIGALVGAGGIEAAFKLFKGTPKIKDLTDKARMSLANFSKNKLSPGYTPPKITLGHGGPGGYYAVPNIAGKLPKPPAPMGPMTKMAPSKIHTPNAVSPLPSMVKPVSESVTAQAGKAVKNIVEVVRGDNFWNLTKSQIKNRFPKLDKVQTRWLVDSIKDKYGENLIKPGQKIDFGKIFNDPAIKQSVRKVPKPGHSTYESIARSFDKVKLYKLNSAAKEVAATAEKSVKSVAEHIDITGLSNETSRILNNTPFGKRLLSLNDPNKVRELQDVIKGGAKFCGKGEFKNTFRGPRGIWNGIYKRPVQDFIKGNWRDFYKESPHFARKNNSELAMMNFHKHTQKVAEIFRAPQKGETIGKWLNDFRKACGRPSYNSNGYFIKK